MPVPPHTTFGVAKLSRHPVEVDEAETLSSARSVNHSGPGSLAETASCVRITGGGSAANEHRQSEHCPHSRFHTTRIEPHVEFGARGPCTNGRASLAAYHACLWRILVRPADECHLAETISYKAAALEMSFQSTLVHDFH